MKSYENKNDLIQTIQTQYKKYIQEFEDIPEALRDTRIDEVDRTPSENLSYQIGWLNLLLGWEEQEKEGIEVHTPAEGYKWNNLGCLYQSFYKKYEKETLKQQISSLNDKVQKLCNWVNSLSDDELFEFNQRQWATTNAQWPIWKWVHINSVAPFTNFRSKIRKWKKIVL